LLFAEMKLPGEAWLEFLKIDKEGNPYLKQTATFRPRGLWGKAVLVCYAAFSFFYF